MRKNILFLSSWYPNKNSPFAGDFIERHAKAVSLLNNVTVLHATRNDNQKKEFDVVLKENDLKVITVYYRGSFFQPLNFFKRLIALNRGYKKVEKVDLIHLNVSYPAGLFALLLKLKNNTKYVITEHWTGFRKDKFQKISFPERFFIKQILKYSQKILPVSQDLANSMLQVYPKKEVEIVPNVVDTQIFSFNNQKTANSVKKFLHLSSLKDEHKNITGMLNVSKRLLEDGFVFEFHIGGTGSKDLIENFKLQNNIGNAIKYFPAISYQDVPIKMKEYDCFVLFSNYENQPCVQGESFAAGLPFIGTDVGGIKEFLPENFGFLIEKGNENELYDALKKVILGHKFVSKEEMNLYAEDNFSYRKIAQKFDEIYNDVLNG